ncbi:hypothetical protein HDK64DRAFT_262995 [Phyllosticta capitalensis]
MAFKSFFRLSIPHFILLVCEIASAETARAPVMCGWRPRILPTSSPFSTNNTKLGSAALHLTCVLLFCASASTCACPLILLLQTRSLVEHSGSGPSRYGTVVQKAPRSDYGEPQVGAPVCAELDTDGCEQGNGWAPTPAPILSPSIWALWGHLLLAL